MSKSARPIFACISQSRIYMHRRDLEIVISRVSQHIKSGGIVCFVPGRLVGFASRRLLARVGPTGIPGSVRVGIRGKHAERARQANSIIPYESRPVAQNAAILTAVIFHRADCVGAG